MRIRNAWTLALATSALTLAAPSWAQQDQAAELAKKLSNPVASLISVPLQYNYDEYSGTNDGASASKLIVQPVIPFSLNNDWNLITRTLIPLVDQKGFPVAALNESGLSDTTASFFFSPKSPTADGWIWGAGPVLLLPTATETELGAEKWGAGPTVVVLKQQNGWTFGALANHVWSFAGDSARDEVSATYLQPFVSFTMKRAMTFTLNTESTYDWHNKQWTVPLNLMVQQLVKVGRQPLALTVGGRYYADKPDGGPDWGLRFAVILLFPK